MNVETAKNLKNNIPNICILLTFSLLGCGQSKSEKTAYPVYNTYKTETSDLHIQSSIIANKFDNSYRITVHTQVTNKSNSKKINGCEITVSSYQLYGQESGLVFDGNSESNSQKHYTQPATTDAGWFITLNGDVKALEDYEIKSDIKLNENCFNLDPFPRSLGKFKLSHKIPNRFERLFYST